MVARVDLGRLAKLGKVIGVEEKDLTRYGAFPRWLLILGSQHRGSLVPQRWPNRHFRIAIRSARFRDRNIRVGFPSVGGRSIPESTLKPADIIVSTTRAKVSGAIRAVTSSIVSHSMLYVGHGHVVEAVGDGVRKVSSQQALSDATLAVALRRAGLSLNLASAVVSFVEEQTGRAYDKRGIAGQAGYQADLWYLCRVREVQDCEDRAARSNLWMQDEDAFFCSELVAAAFAHVGLPLTDTQPAAVSPQTLIDVVSTGKLQYVGHLLGSS